MTVRPIATIGHPVLRERAREITIDELRSPAMQELVDDLIDTMRAAGGAGIAANQVHETVRVAVIEVDQNPRYPYKPRIPLTVVVNPVIEMLDEEWVRAHLGTRVVDVRRDEHARDGEYELVEINEGCLSVPDLRGAVERYVNIRVRYLDRDGNPHDEVKRGLTAGTFQHELDHLDGVLFVDRVRDPRTLTTWEQFERFHRDAFVARITEFVARVGS
jgi:peptide deformylase